MTEASQAPDPRRAIVVFVPAHHPVPRIVPIVGTDDELADLGNLLSGLHDLGHVAIFVVAAPLTGDRAPADAIDELRSTFGELLVDAVSHGGSRASRTDEPAPDYLAPLWEFEPLGSEAVLRATARLLCTDFDVLAFRVDRDGAGRTVADPRAAGAFDLWMKAAGGSTDLSTVSIPGFAGEYAVFAGPFPVVSVVASHEPFAELVRRFSLFPDEPADVEDVSLAEVLGAGRDPQGILGYLRRFAGRDVRSLDDLEAAVAALEDEEELGAFRVLEGVALSIASQGAWILFRP